MSDPTEPQPGDEGDVAVCVCVSVILLDWCCSGALAIRVRFVYVNAAFGHSIKQASEKSKHMWVGGERCGLGER